jgi:hypothetical protein
LKITEIKGALFPRITLPLPPLTGIPVFFSLSTSSSDAVATWRLLLGRIPLVIPYENSLGNNRGQAL